MTLIALFAGVRMSSSFLINEMLSFWIEVFAEWLLALVKPRSQWFCGQTASWFWKQPKWSSELSFWEHVGEFNYRFGERVSQTGLRLYHCAVTAEGRSERGKDQSMFFWLLKGAEMETGCLEGENDIRLNPSQFEWESHDGNLTRSGNPACGFWERRH